MAFHHFDTYLFVFVQRAIQRHKEGIACAVLNKVQHRLPENVPEDQAHTAVNTSHAYGIDKRRWKQFIGTGLVHVADDCQGFVIPALLIGLKVNGIERASLQLPPWTLVSDVFEIHSLAISD